MNYRLGMILLLLYLSLVPTVQAQTSDPAVPTASRGVLDLRYWDVDEDGSVRLDGQWEFYWQQFIDPQAEAGIEPIYIEVPQTWGAQQIDGVQLSDHGYGTYRLMIRIRPEDQGEVFALAIPSIATAYSLWINGQLADSQGTLGKSREEMTAQNFTKTVYFTADSPEVELILQVSNFVQRKGGMWSSLVLGADEQVTLAREKNIIIQITIAGGLLIMGLYHIGLYLFRRVYIPTLWFGIASVLICLRTLFTGDFLWNRLWPAFPWEIAVKIEYLSAYLAIAMLILYTHALYPRDMSKKITYALFYLIVLISMPVLLFPARTYTETMLPAMIVLISSLAYPVFGVIRAAIRKRTGARLNLVFVLLFFATVINDTLFYNYIVNTGDLLPWGLYMLLFTQTLVLAARFSGAFTEVENLTDELRRTNQTLELKVKERTRELELANEQLQRMEASRRHMLANIAHEFGTPLTSLIGYVSVLQEDELPAHSRKYMDVIYDKATLLRRLTDDLKEVVQLETKTIRLVFTLEKLLDWYRSIGAKFEMDVAGAGLRFQQEPLMQRDDELTQLYVRIDTKRIDQVLTNLIFNAISHTDEGGSIIVRARCFMPWRTVMISVTDTGAGIRREDIPYIFDRFYKGSHTTRNQRSGSGLGLSIASEIIQQHGGRLGVRSVEGRGSSFYMLLPLYTLEDDHLDGGIAT